MEKVSCFSNQNIDRRVGLYLDLKDESFSRIGIYKNFCIPPADTLEVGEVGG
jgi:hypothetical protein